MPFYIIEHLEPKLYEWCFLEYRHISKIVGKKNLLFTNLKNLTNNEIAKLKKLGKTEEKSVLELNLDKNKTCILDPNAKKTLTPKIAKKFENFIFGGILGDNPPKARTYEFLTQKSNFPAFNLGKMQMSTDTAVAVCKEIIFDKSLAKLKFKNNLEIRIEKNLWEELPYRYLIKNNKILFTPGVKKLLKKFAEKGL
ncbi:MAG: SAM-dependent methyltransferase [Candidatus Nanoarchaeia archaeon]